MYYYARIIMIMKFPKRCTVSTLLTSLIIATLIRLLNLHSNIYIKIREELILIYFWLRFQYLYK